MYFKVLAHGLRPPAGSKSGAFLLTDNWDDWFKYNTMYTLVVIDNAGERHSIGSVKIGQFNMEEGQRHPDLPTEFDALDERFFSIGQDDSYYDDLNKLGFEIRRCDFESLLRRCRRTPLALCGSFRDAPSRLAVLR
jgi:hypothetical protein